VVRVDHLEPAVHRDVAVWTRDLEPTHIEMTYAADPTAIELVVRAIREIEEDLRAMVVVLAHDDVLDRAAYEIGEG
jgi:ABC-type polar amino acid transport system ATPase subunit